MLYEVTKITIIGIKRATPNVHKRFPPPYLRFMELKFNQWKNGSKRAPHKPLLFLLALGKWQQGQKQLTWKETAPVLENLLEQYGPTTRKPTPENPWARLQNDGFWELTPKPILHNGNYRAQDLLAQNSTGQLSPAVEAELRSNPGALRLWVLDILEEQFAPSQHDAVLNACGITLDAQTPSAKRKRDPNFAQAVLNNYQYQCGLCGFNLHLNKQPVGLEAAHIQWHAFEGPDHVRNGIALCSLHHTLFDLGAFALSDELTILISSRIHGTSLEYLAQYHKAPLLKKPFSFEEPGLEYVRWQREQVFKA